MAVLGAVAPASISGGNGDGSLQAAIAAQHAGDHAGAEAAYRLAWEDPASRETAADALRALYEHGRVAPAVDDAALSAARTQLGPDFLLTETRHYMILSDADQAWTRQRGVVLERARHQYFRVMERLDAPVYPHERKLLCILFRDFERYRAFSRAEDGRWAEWVAGYYSPVTNRIVFYDDRTSPAYGQATAAIDDAARKVRELRSQAGAAKRQGQTQYAAALLASAEDLESRIGSERGRLTETTRATSTAKSIHEAVHLLAFNTGLQRRDRDYPFWLSEGLATCFETDDPGGAFGPDHAKRGDAMAPLTEVALETLIGLAEVPAGDAEDAQSRAQGMYDRSRGLFAYLYRYRRKELAGYFRAILAEPPGLSGPERRVAMFREAFGDPEALERRLKAK